VPRLGCKPKPRDARSRWLCRTSGTGVTEARLTVVARQGDSDRRLAMKKLLLTLALLVSIGAGAPAMAADTLPDEVAATLAFMREEEKLAHDVYLLFSEMYAQQEAGSKIFVHIAESEQRHTDAVKALLEDYGLADPAAALAPGEFANEMLQELYTTLVNVGTSGFTEALGVGVVIEQKDMTDIVAVIDLSAAYADIVNVYSNLLAGSEHHLAAFLKALDTAQPGTAIVGSKSP
jgi:hypothetical protein